MAGTCVGKAVLEVLYVGGQEGHGEVVPGKIWRAGDRQRCPAGSEDGQDEVGVVGGEVGEPEVALREDLRVNFGQVAEVPGCGWGYLREKNQVKRMGICSRLSRGMRVLMPLRFMPIL
jgi:hypothetical protein